MPGSERDQRRGGRRPVSTSSRSPAPKFSTATTVPTGSPSPIDAGEADQVGVIIFALLERRQRGAVDLDQRSAQRFGGGAVGDALEAGDRAPCPVAATASRRSSAPPTNSCRVRGEAVGAVAEQLEPHLALDAMGPGDGGERDPAPSAAAGAMDYSAFAPRLRRPARQRSSAGSFGRELPRPGASSAGAPRPAPLGRARRPRPPRRLRRPLRHRLGRGFFGRSFGSGFGRDRLFGGSVVGSAGGCSSAGASGGRFGGRSFLSGGFLGRGLFGRSFARPALPRPTASSTAGFFGRRILGGLGGLGGFGGLGRLGLDALLGLFARLGLLRVVARGALRMPAASRKRRTRSDGWAPTLSQCEMRSASSFTRSGESLASSGL